MENVVKSPANMEKKLMYRMKSSVYLQIRGVPYQIAYAQFQIFRGDCNFKKRNKTCAVACPHGYATPTEDVIACLPNATWCYLPLCFKTHCSRPVLDREILKEENCTFKKIKETFWVHCVQVDAY
ncbi:hypothetical protein TNIN_237811 [Trichonephila inaurata madagascariensis]|uniref:Uncharacterized protein n=1 Tax=Trichonephila inaurata madagascariensis TaxID=2747483 RepID=A0A8X6Y5G8_9ARAC|nr:hypothetical protein TNIN_237811 [Trichonephila inaurata madagascariensis]